ncbi:predicted protein [Chaetomium globosum CBS 148.51]|uniref:Uncharacterized protein n=1 Tax=Chaetomium globosum (strain ATCC 6205 / CBS 148.51 / DSM 1962 / NBRC 6347 / NRRL 1970) TaxID=306901 RepID=Q2HAA1_CHAGB|nr:uncharacterized protein CHGG_02853 [Chaetomium globosum CBS 148.51]EAQ90918.1 predicted protein [Chaetomium globosum CBS 148.51]
MPLFFYCPCSSARRARPRSLWGTIISVGGIDAGGLTREEQLQLLQLLVVSPLLDNAVERAVIEGNSVPATRQHADSQTYHNNNNNPNNLAIFTLLLSSPPAFSSGTPATNASQNMAPRMSAGTSNHF